MGKKVAEMTKEELQEELDKEREKSAKLQSDKEARENEADRLRRDNDARARADALAAQEKPPTEDEWLNLEKEYGTDRATIAAAWKIAQKTAAPLLHKIRSYEARDAASEAFRLAKERAKAEDAQFPKYEYLVDEYMKDISSADKANPESLTRHMDRAIHFAKGKARATDKTFRDEHDAPIRDENEAETKASLEEGFGEFSIKGLPLTIHNEKLVPDDFRKRHAHPDIKGAVRMDERARWQEQIPKKPRA